MKRKMKIRLNANKKRSSILQFLQVNKLKFQRGVLLGKIPLESSLKIHLACIALQTRGADCLNDSTSLYL